MERSGETNIFRGWLTTLGAKNLSMEPVSPWENGYCESFNGKLRDVLLNGENFCRLKVAKVVIEQWRNRHNNQTTALRPELPATNTHDGETELIPIGEVANMQ